MSYDTVFHFVAGGVAGTAGAIATCPLEVVKTRLQSSVANFNYVIESPTSNSVPTVNQRYGICAVNYPDAELATNPRHKSLGIWRCLKYIVENEGPRALFKGLGPNLVGVAPSRAIYFCTYSNTKVLCNSIMTPDTPLVHIYAAASAGFVSCTLTNPIWMVKTRLQLDQRMYGSMSTMQCIRDIYCKQGLLGFYKGITASYFGISETVIHFVIYEYLKAKLRERRNPDYINPVEKSTPDFIESMIAGAISKTSASILAYPHEVVRTRLRQEGDKYKSFFQTMLLVFKEEGHHGLYRGLATQLVRQIPNTAIMMATYELVVHVLTRYHYHYTVPSLSMCEEE